MAKQGATGPLSEIKVVDFGHYYAGPLTGMLLADQGAEVIRVLKPGGEELPSQQFRVFNRNKKIVKIDLKSEEGKAQALRLIKSADVLIENFRPGVMKRLGLDYASVKTLNPGLVYLSLPGFASTDKQRSHIQAWEGVMGAASCLYRETSVFRERFGYPPVVTWVPQCSMYGGMLGIQSVMAALLKREQTGSGTIIEIPMVDATMMILTYKVWMHSIGVEAVNDPLPVPDDLKHLMYSATDTKEQTLRKLTAATWDAFGMLATNRAHHCSDGRQILHWTNNAQKFNTKFLKALGIYDVLINEGFVDFGCWEQSYDNNISDQANLTDKRKARLAELIRNAFLEKTSEEWDTILGDAGVPTGMFRTRSEWLKLDAMLSSGVLAQMSSQSPELTTVGRFADVSDASGRVIEPRFYEPEYVNAEQFFKALAPGETDISIEKAQDVKKHELLSGLKILDFTNVAAGPIGCAGLAQFGANVVKVDPPEFFMGPTGLAISAQYMHGKRCILIDPSSAQAREVLERLFGWADIVVHNSVDGTDARLGVSFDQVNKINPKAVVCQLSAFGGTYRNRGGWERRVGFDLSLQSASGMMAQFGTIEYPQWHSNVATTDIMGGYSVCVAALLGAYQATKTGTGSEARTSLARMINYVQLPFMIAENGNSDWGEPRGQFAKGFSWYQRMYECADGQWIFVGTSQMGSSDLLELAGVDIVEAEEVSLEEALEAQFAQKSAAEWCELLIEAGMGAHRVVGAKDVFEIYPVRELNSDEFVGTHPVTTEILSWSDHPWELPIVQIAPNFIRVGEEASWYVPTSGNYFGQHSQEILEEIGFDEHEVSDMIANKSVHEFLVGLSEEGVHHLGQKSQRSGN